MPTYTKSGERIIKKNHFCPVCKKAFQCPAHIRAHMVTHTGERPYMCDHCGKNFAQRSNLKLHIHKIHFDKVGPRNSKKDNIKKHDLKKHVCPQCDKRYRSSRDLKAHFYTHTGERPFSCHICSSRFTQKAHLKTHLITHSGKRPYKCSDCGKSYGRKTHLNQHCKTIHTGVKPYKCPICGHGCSGSSNLDQHIKTHSKVKAFPCPHSNCFKGYKNKDTLKKHISAFHQEFNKPSHELLSDKLFKDESCSCKDEAFSDCDVCIGGFCNMKDLWNHLATHGYNNNQESRKEPSQGCLSDKVFKDKICSCKDEVNSDCDACIVGFWNLKDL